MAFDAGTIETTLDLNRTPFNQGLDKAEKDARAFERKRFKAKVDVEIDQRQLDRDINRTTSKRPKIGIDAEIDQKKVVRQIDAIAENTERTAARSGNRFARLLLNPVMIQLGLLPAAAAAASVLAGAAFAAPVAIFAAWGIAATKSSAEVKNSWMDLKREVIDGSKEIAAPMKGAVVGSINEMRAGFAGAKPELQSMFRDAAPYVQQFTRSLVGMVTNTLPGFHVALQRGDGIMRGWDTMLDRIGVGISDFIDQATRIEDVDRAMGHTGVTIEVLLGFIGRLVAMFGNAWADAGSEFNQTLAMAADLASRFGQSALPSMVGGLNMTLSILQAIMTILGPFMNILGSGVGTVLAAAAAYRLLGSMVRGVGNAAGGVRNAVGSAVSTMGQWGAAAGLVSDRTKKMNSDIDESEKKQSKFSKATSMVSSVLGKVGASIPIAGAAFALLGGIIDAVVESNNRKFREQQDAAERSADRVRLAQEEAAAALRTYNRDSRIFGEGSRRAADAQEALAQAVLREKDAQNDAARATQTHTQRLMEFFSALTGGLSAQVNYNNTVRDLKTKHDELNAAIKEHGPKSMEAKFAADELSLAMANQVQAAADLALANAAGKSEVEKLTAAQAAAGLEAFRLIEIFGNQAPPALFKLMGGLSDTELAAMGAKRSFDQSGNAIIDLNGKKITIQHNFVEAGREGAALRDTVNSIPTGTRSMKYFIETIISGPTNIPKPGGPPIPLIPGNARGTGHWGGGLTQINEQGPELIQLPQGAKVFTNRSTQLMMERMMVNIASQIAGSGGTNPVELASAVSAAVASALHGTRIEFDPQGVARIVNMSNLRNRGR